MTFQFVNFVNNFNTFIENLRNVYIYMYVYNACYFK